MRKLNNINDYKEWLLRKLKHENEKYYFWCNYTKDKQNYWVAKSVKMRINAIEESLQKIK